MPTQEMAHAILFIFTTNGPTHVLSTIFKCFCPDQKNVLRNYYLCEQRVENILKKTCDFDLLRRRSVEPPEIWLSWHGMTFACMLNFLTDHML